MKQRGLGDTVKAGLRAVGIEKDCNPCAKRQENLNNLVPYDSGAIYRVIEIVDGIYKRYVPKSKRSK
jgi:hypothetical protein